jgi:hypothetical protein
MLVAAINDLLGLLHTKMDHEQQHEEKERIEHFVKFLNGLYG